ncbi:trehalase family glycosidase [Escherichia coli]
MTFWVIEIARSWLKRVNQFYLEQHKMIEKYHIADGVPREGGGGKYAARMGLAGLTVWYAV